MYSETGKAQLKEQVAYYMKNASVIYDGLKEAGYNGVGRRERAVYLAGDAKRDDFLGIL